MDDRLSVFERRLDRLSAQFDSDLFTAFATVPPLVAHSVEVAKQLSLGVAAVYGVDVEGEVAEFGTMTGVTAVSLARAIALSDTHLGYAVRHAGLNPKSLHLFDSFEGLPSTDNPTDTAAPHVRSGVWAPGTCVGLSKEELEARVKAVLDPARVRVFAGWFSATIPTIPAATKYALVHIDSDLYSSAIDVLDGLLGRNMLAEGAHLYFDDWNCNKASPEYGERRAWQECVEKYRIRYSDEGGYGLFAHKFIVHSYRQPA